MSELRESWTLAGLLHRVSGGTVPITASSVASAGTGPVPRKSAAVSVKCRANVSLIVASTLPGSKTIARPINATSLRSLRKLRNRGCNRWGGPQR